ncbi:MAG TPA: TQO small subunit DoxD [Gaiellaceae bacterium]
MRVPTVPTGLAFLPLRLFLGGTFVYAGLQKLLDPGFLTEGAPTYIGSQLEAFANGTPGGALLRALALPIPEVAGVGVAVFEIAVGLLAFFGLLTRAAAFAGFALSTLLFLTASWKTRPYFLGPDLVFAFAWLPFVLAGAQGQPALDHVSMRRLRLQRRALGPVPSIERGAPLTRRGFVGVALGAAGAAALLAAGGATLARGAYRRPPAPKAGAPALGVEIAGGGDLAPGQALVYPDPIEGRSDILIRADDGTLTAFSAICTHAGCEVTYQDGLLLCPCHGGVFNAQTGAVEGGPPPTPLPARQVVERGGKVYAARG